MTGVATQLTLSLTPQEVYRLDNFLFVQAELQQVIHDFCIGHQWEFLYLHSEQGLGKTHLLLACVEQFNQQDQQAMYLPLSILVKTSQPEVLAELDHISLLCLDDIEAIAGLPEWEEALFHCFNRRKEAKGRLLVSATNSPKDIDIKLPDLRSRLATGLIFQLQSMTDEQKQQALILQAHAYGLSLNEEVSQYLLRHHGRDMPSLMSQLMRLDKASLQSQRKLTIPFVKQTLA